MPDPPTKDEIQLIGERQLALSPARVRDELARLARHAGLDMSAGESSLTFREPHQAATPRSKAHLVLRIGEHGSGTRVSVQVMQESRAIQYGLSFLFPAPLFLLDAPLFKLALAYLCGVLVCVLEPVWGAHRDAAEARRLRSFVATALDRVGAEPPKADLSSPMRRPEDDYNS